MAILAECPACHTKQGKNNKKCSCGQDMDRAKQAKRARYWIRYRVPNGTDENGKKLYKQKTELVKGEDVNPCSIEDARAMHSKRVVQKKEGKIFDVKEDDQSTFKEFSDWYLGQEDIKTAPSYRIIKIRLDKLNEDIGYRIVSDIQPSDLRNFRAKREKEGLSDSYIDDLIGAGKAVINRAFSDGKVGVDTLRKWKSVKKVLSVGDNARDRVISPEEFDKLYKQAPEHLQGILLIQYWTGLRENDVLALTWDRVDLQTRMIRFEVTRRRTQKPKPVEIYIVDELYNFLAKHQGRLRAIDEDNHVIQYGKKKEPVKSFKTAFKTACENAGIPYGTKADNGIVPHDLRHTSITDMRRAGVNELVNRKWHGHSIRDAHGGYHTIDREDLKRAGEMLHNYRRKIIKSQVTENVTSNYYQSQNVT